MTDLQNLIRQVELKKKNLELERRFQNNLSLLKRVAPDVHQEYATYRPKKIKMTLTPEGYVNLVNTGLNNKPVYPEDPATYVRRHVERFQKTPAKARLNMRPRDNVLDIENDAHMKYNNEILRRVQERRGAAPKALLPDSPRLMIVLGVGLGHHLELLLREHDIRYLILIEPNRDIFHASLHTCDWEWIFDRFSGEARNLQLLLGRTPTETVQLFQEQIYRIGAYNAATPYIFHHLSSQEHERALEEGLRGINKTVSTLGYFDDERVGLAHTVDNLRKKCPILAEHVSRGSPPIKERVFIIANGPSLDKAKNYLAENQDQALIISCGTALGSLAKLGIKPHIHVEMERTRPVVEWIENGTDAAFRRNIQLVALNTVHPEVFDLFEDRYLILKPNDLGTSYTKQLVKAGKRVIQLPHSNPTVANTAAAFAASLGASEIYFFGLDLGFSSGAQHHSTLSKHYDIKEEHVEALHLYQHDSNENITAKANFGGTVTTNGVYINAKISFEQLIKSSPASRFFNTSEGLFIEGAKPVPIDQIAAADHPISTNIVGNLFRRYFSDVNLTKIPSKQAITSEFQPAVKLLDQLDHAMELPYSTLEQCDSAVEQQHRLYRKLVKTDGNEAIDALLKGSIENFTMALQLTLVNNLDETETVALFNECAELYRAFLGEAKWKIRNELLRLDRRQRNIAEKTS